MKKHFPKPVDEARIAQYYEEHIASDSVDALIDAFAVPANLERNKSFLCIALARQVAAFINSKDENVEVLYGVLRMIACATFMCVVSIVMLFCP